MPILISFWIYFLGVFNDAPPLTANSVQLVGSACWDAATGVDLKSTVYAIVAGKKIKLGDSDSNGKFNLQIPTNVQALIFESDGYVSVQKNVYFFGAFNGGSKFQIGLPIHKKGAVVVEKSTKEKYNRNPDTVIFCFPDSHRKGMQYELFRAKNRSLLVDFSSTINRSSSFNTDRVPGDYIVTVKSQNGEILLEKSFVIKDGISIVDLHAVESKRENVAQPVTGTEVSFDKRTLYFEQSKYDLQEDSKLTLDSVASYLSNHRAYRILVVGHTDNIGKKEPNVILSEYRARAVSGYLRNKGVLANQITTKWEGATQQSEAADVSKKIENNKRVVIEIIK